MSKIKAQKKIPQSALHSSENKTVRFADQKIMPYLSWRFSGVDKGGPFQWPENDADLIHKIHKRLASFDSMKWAEVEGSDHHNIPKDKLTKIAQRRLDEIKLDDIDGLLSFHLDGRKRIFGIKDLGTIKLLWWDENHQVCESKKKNT